MAESQYERVVRQRRYLAECPYCHEIAFAYKVLKDSLIASPDKRKIQFDAVTDTLDCRACHKNLSHVFSRKATLMVIKTTKKKP